MPRHGWLSLRRDARGTGVSRHRSRLTQLAGSALDAAETSPRRPEGAAAGGGRVSRPRAHPHRAHCPASAIACFTIKDRPARVAPAARRPSRPVVTRASGRGRVSCVAGSRDVHGPDAGDMYTWGDDQTCRGSCGVNRNTAVYVERWTAHRGVSPCRLVGLRRRRPDPA